MTPAEEVDQLKKQNALLVRALLRERAKSAALAAQIAAAGGGAIVETIEACR
jgi:hypothetical protein